jgi:hypothetical protein
MLLPAAAGCRDRLQDEGRYAFTAEEVAHDGCGLVQAGGALFGATFFSTGNIVRLRYDWHQMLLAGAYLDRAFADPAPERFMADGTAANVWVDRGGAQCQLDQAVVHLEATTLSPLEFHGALRFRYEVRQPESCECETWVTRYRAVHE